MATEELITENEVQLEEPAARAHRRRRDGVEYKLRVIPGSDGLLELVEVHEPNPFLEWARLVQLTGWYV